MNTQICNICNTEKTLEYFVKDKKRLNGVRGYCLECDRLKRGGKPRPKKGYKVCAKCGQELRLDDFNTRTIAGKKKPFSYCKPCERETNNTRYKHVCTMCGKKYKSGRKNTTKCKNCHNKIIGIQGTKVLNSIDWSGKNNPMYGVQRFGKENPNYNPELTDNDRIHGRFNFDYKLWRKAVYERDRYSCDICGDNKGGNLIAHHLNSYSWDKENRLNINNGITLCECCHLEFHNEYGYKRNSKEQYYEFKNSKLIPR